MRYTVKIDVAKQNYSSRQYCCYCDAQQANHTIFSTAVAGCKKRGLKYMRIKILAKVVKFLSLSYWSVY